ncbi:hypothetical protein TNCT_168671 [Trichonephila clavata]|uniref:Uncharacterized protein n=1 Tax=Trichonephila clavata TaxID=2740835 RepID=A0A8X6EXQ6_TRICU|nr:hypothetical protein TNCT_168671 [Trichonephila clavata]
MNLPIKNQLFISRKESYDYLISSEKMSKIRPPTQKWWANSSFYLTGVEEYQKPNKFLTRNLLIPKSDPMRNWNWISESGDYKDNKGSIAERLFLLCTMLKNLNQGFFYEGMTLSTF